VVRRDLTSGDPGDRYPVERVIRPRADTSFGGTGRLK
jgi:hypothetical protein